MIKLMCIGHLGKDCVVNQVNGKDVINFSVAHTESYKDKEGVKKEKTTWVECNYWPTSPAIAPYLRKGQQVYVEGTPEVYMYTKNDGGQGVSLKCRVFTVQLLGSGKKEEGGAAPSNETAAPAGGYKPIDTPAAADGTPPPADELPF